MDADVVGAFLSETKSMALIHELGRKCPRKAREILDIATIHGLRDEAVYALCPHLGL